MSTNLDKIKQMLLHMIEDIVSLSGKRDCIHEKSVAQQTKVPISCTKTSN